MIASCQWRHVGGTGKGPTLNFWLSKNTWKILAWTLHPDELLSLQLIEKSPETSKLSRQFCCSAPFCFQVADAYGQARHIAWPIIMTA